MTHTIRCAHCHRTHSTKQEVFNCSQLWVPVSQSVKAAPAPPVVPTYPFRTPEAMVRNMRDGYYAVNPDGNDEDYSAHVFIRVSHPKNGKKKGCLVIQTQHSDDYKPFITFYPSGSIYVGQRGDRLDQALMLVAANPFGTTQKYAKIFKVCSRCHKQLTDERSRYYGIGPECEKHWPEIINEVNETRGAFSRAY